MPDKPTELQLMALTFSTHFTTYSTHVYILTYRQTKTYTTPYTHTHTDTYMYEVVFGESEIWQRNWGHEFYPTFTVCIHTM